MIRHKQSRTCIAAVKDKRGRIVMAADRRASWDFSQAQAMPRPKIQKRNGLLLAGTGDGYLCTLIVDLLHVPVNEVEDPDTYMHWTLLKEVNKLLKAKGFVDQHNQLRIPADSGVEVLIACSGRLYTLTIDNPEPYKETPGGLISIDEVSLPYASGCGGQLAWGSLLTTGLLGTMKAKERLTIALTVAAEVSPGCDANIDIEIEN